MTDGSLIIPNEDFWSRQANAQRFEFDFTPLGIPAHITSNDNAVLQAAQLSAQRYIHMQPTDERAIRIQIAVSEKATHALPHDLSERLAYSGLDDWIALFVDQWGHSFGNLRTREAVVFLSRALADDTRLVSRYFIDHYLLNFILTRWAMLHASCVYDSKARRLIIIVATHNMGKSTTALRLVRGGYQFLADGMAQLKRDKQGLLVGGYPIGEVKLRSDVLKLFPEYRGEEVMLREQSKTIIDLRVAHPRCVIDSLVRPAVVHICALERDAVSHTRIAPLARDEALALFKDNTMFWHDARYLTHNSAVLQHLLHKAKLHRLIIGSDANAIVAAVDQLI